MATRQSTVDFIVDQCASAGDVSARKMFGEYGLYCGGKLVGLICEDQLFLTITPPGRALFDESHDGEPYPGSKPKIRIPAAALADADSMGRLVRETADALPLPSSKRKR